MSESHPDSASKKVKKAKRRSSATHHEQPTPSSPVNATAGSSRLPPPEDDVVSDQAASTEISKKAKKEARKVSRALASGANGSHGSMIVSAAVGMPNGKGKAPERQQPSIEQWEAVHLAQSAASHIPHVWSRDGRFFFTVSGSSINVHSGTHPYPRLSTLSAPGSANAHLQVITALVPHPSNSMQIVSASQDSTIKVWDWVEGHCVRSFDLDGPAGGMCVGKMNEKWAAFAFITKDRAPSKSGKHSDESTHSVIQIPLSSSKDKSPAVRVIRNISTPPSSIIISPSSTFLVVLAKHKAYAFDLTTRPDGRPKQVKFASDQILTCGAFAPSNALGDREEWFATGDIKGVIRLWHGLSSAFKQVSNQGKDKDADRRLPTTSMHWHAHGVCALAFTSSGAQLLSVGEESVLVQWHLASGRREYIPRLGGKPLQSLSVRSGDKAREEEWWMMMSDGASVKVGASSGKVQTIAQGVRFDPLISISEKPFPLELHPSSSALVLPSSHASTLQWVDPSSTNVLFDLEVAPSNRVSRRDKEVIPVSIDRIAFSDLSGGRVKWMATLETRESDLSEGGGGQNNLKIWAWQNQKYVVNTQFPRPHGVADLTSITFSNTPTHGDSHTNDPLLLTTASDGSAKLWHVRQARKSEQGKTSTKKASAFKQFWAQRSAFDYRNMPITDSALSPDGTIVALCHSSIVSLWNTDNNVLLRALAPAQDAQLSKIAFVGKEGRHLVATGDGGVVVWDMLSCDVVHTIPGSVEDLAVLPNSNNFMTLSKSPSPSSSTVNLYSTASAIPLRQIQTSSLLKRILPLPASYADPKAHLELVGLSTASHIVRLGDRVTASSASSANIQVSEKKSTSVWQEMFGKEAFLEPLAPLEASSAPIPRRSGRPADVFEGPSHTIPSTSLLFDAFIENVLSDTVKVSTVEDVEMGEETKIRYDEPVDAVEESVQQQVKPREVTDQDVKKLESFFREVLSIPAASASKPKVNGVPNGHAHESEDASDSDDSEIEPRPTSSPKAALKKVAPHKSRRQSNGSASEREEVSHAVKGRGMKRKA